MIPAILIPIIANIGEKVFDRLVRNPEIPVTPADRAAIQPTVEAAVRTEVGPVIEHLTNNEPWFRSRVTLGAIAAILSPLLGLLGYQMGAEQITEILMVGGPILGGLLALYGRWAARKPIGD